nr:hypothetical protein [Tanacetum cinerariifolium]
MHEFWFTITKTKDSSSYKFKLDKKKFKFGVEVFREVLQICHRLPNQEFVEPPSHEEIVIFITELGYRGELESITKMCRLALTFKSSNPVGNSIPKKDRKRTTTHIKESSLTIDDNIILNDLDTALELAKSISKIKAEKQEAARLVYETHESMLETDTKKEIKASKRDFRSQHQTACSSEGVGSKPEGDSEDDDDDHKSNDERTKTNDDKSIDLDKIDDEEGTQKDEFVHTHDDYVPMDDETQDVDDEEYVRINEELYDDVKVEMKDVKPADEGKGDKEITDTKKVDVEHEKVNQEVKSAKVQDDVQETTTVVSTTQKEKTGAPSSSSGRSVSSNYGSIFLNLDNIYSAETDYVYVGCLGLTRSSKNPVFITAHCSCFTSKSFNNHPKHMALYHALMESILVDEDAMNQGVIDKQKKRKPADEDRDKDPLVRPDQGLKRRKTSKDAKPSKRSQSTGSSKGNTSSQPKPKSTGKSVHVEETVYEDEATEAPQNQGDDMGTTNEQPNVEDASNNDCKPLPLVESRGHQIVPARYFFNNDLEYLRGGSTDRKYITSITKTNAAKYELNGIEDMVPTLWSPIMIAYDKHAALGDFPRIHMNDIEDVLLLVVQNKLFNLKGDIIFDLAVALRMFTRRIVIQKRVEDLQLRIERYQKKLNISKPIARDEDLSRRAPYTTLSYPQGVIYEDKMNRKRLMRSDELHKFSDGTLQSVQDTLHDMKNNLKMRYKKVIPRRKWSNLDKKRSHIMVKDIDR